ncbi:hypothetical protein GOC72_18810 [Sinorhizobium medicae]|nr:hypothetical protein [Sinorhizobium medicae]
MKQVTAERDYLRQKLHGPGLAKGPGVEKEMTLPTIQDSVRLPLIGSIKADLGEFQTRVMARTYPRSGAGLGVHYYADARELDSARSQANLLGYLHENFIRQLADFLRT